MTHFDPSVSSPTPVRVITSIRGKAGTAATPQRARPLLRGFWRRYGGATLAGSVYMALQAASLILLLLAMNR